MINIDDDFQLRLLKPEAKERTENLIRDLALFLSSECTQLAKGFVLICGSVHLRRAISPSHPRTPEAEEFGKLVASIQSEVDALRAMKRGDEEGK